MLVKNCCFRPNDRGLPIFYKCKKIWEDDGGNVYTVWEIIGVRAIRVKVKKDHDLIFIYSKSFPYVLQLL